LVKNFKLVPRPLKQESRTKKWQFEAKMSMAPVLEGKSIGSDQNTVLKGARRRALDLEN
jgi:hypothetical protein